MSADESAPSPSDRVPTKPEGGAPRRAPRESSIPSSIPPGIHAGVLLDETYELVRPLGEGAMGMVYLGRDVRLEREVAIKFIQPEMVRSEEAHERFLREARTMARVRHENVVEIYTYGELLGSPYFVMEYVPGTNVDEWLRIHGQPHLSIDESIRDPRPGLPRRVRHPRRRRGPPRFSSPATC